MDLIYYSPNIARGLLAEFLRNNLVYGTGSEYGSLLSASSTQLTSREAEGIREDPERVWHLYRTLSKLYSASMRGEAPSWIAGLAEHRLGPRKVKAHRLVTEAGLEPRLCRIDYVSIGEERKIAEVQWKSGGLGLFFGIPKVYSEVIPGSPDNDPLGDSLRNFCLMIRRGSALSEAVATNGVRYPWFKAEHFLKKHCLGLGVRYFPIHGEELPGRIFERRGRYFVSERGALHEVDFLYGREAGEIYERGLLRLVEATLEGRVWTETPLNYLYRQKWCLAVPFMPEFKNLFDDALREILIPTALLRADHMDLSPLVPFLDHKEKERLTGLKSIEAIAELPASLRSSLVIKCGAGRGGLHSRGRGVFRLGGSRASALRILDMVQTRVTEESEPWIVQNYVDKTYAIDVSHPGSPECNQHIDGHARFMIFAGRTGFLDTRVFGGLATYGRHWKVGGKSPGTDAKGRVTGTAFNDIRVGKE